jgi:AGZA family xanthine/uracil permease-like MFS transporter
LAEPSGCSTFGRLQDITFIKTLLTMLQKLFGFAPAHHKVRTEIYAGITTFLTMAYILAVNPSVFSALEPKGMPTSAVFTTTMLGAC